MHSEGEGKGSTFRLQLPMERDSANFFGIIDMNEHIYDVSLHSNIEADRGLVVSYSDSSSKSQSPPISPPNSLVSSMHYPVSQSNSLSNVLDDRISQSSDCLIVQIDNATTMSISNVDYGIIPSSIRNSTKTSATLSDVNLSSLDSFSLSNRISSEFNTDVVEYNDKSLKILVVDDSKINRKMLCRILINQGHRCEEAIDGVEAVEAVRRMMYNSSPPQMQGLKSNLRSYDVILMDSVMPNMEGPEATMKIKDLGFTGPVIGVTGNAMERDKDIFVKAGALKVLTKPLNLTELNQVFKGKYYDAFVVFMTLMTFIFL